MVSLIYNNIDPVSKNSRDYVVNKYANMPYLEIVDIKEELVNAQLPDSISEPAIFVSKHSSSKSIGSFTVHAEGNWSSKADLGGLPHKLSMSSPVEMLNVLLSMARAKISGMEVTYEATHHGPFTMKRSFFAEVGGNDQIVSNPKMAISLSDAIFDALDNKESASHIAVGIGSNHYPVKFTRLALEKRIAFAHIMPKYYVEEVDMLWQAFEASKPKPEMAVIEWKSISASQRQNIIEKLNEIGMDYERV